MRFNAGLDIRTDINETQGVTITGDVFVGSPVLGALGTPCLTDPWGGRVAPCPLCWPCSLPCASHCINPEAARPLQPVRALLARVNFALLNRLTGAGAGGHKESSREQKPSSLAPANF